MTADLACWALQHTNNDGDAAIAYLKVNVDQGKEVLGLKFREIFRFAGTSSEREAEQEERISNLIRLTALEVWV